MLKWVTQKVGVGAKKAHMDELNDFIEKLRTIGDVEMGSLVDMVAEYKIIFESKNILVSDPIDYIKTKPAILLRFEEFVKDLKKGDDHLKRMAVEVWLHTLRAALAMDGHSDPHGFGKMCKFMWKELSRGFSSETGATDFPVGFDPNT